MLIYVKTANNSPTSFLIHAASGWLSFFFLSGVHRNYLVQIPAGLPDILDVFCGFPQSFQVNARTVSSYRPLCLLSNPYVLSIPDVPISFDVV
jgi:hypothetical protein